MRRNLFISPSPGFVRGWCAGIPKPGVVHPACQQALERTTFHLRAHSPAGSASLPIASFGKNHAVIRISKRHHGLVPAHPPANEGQPVAVLGPQAAGNKDAVFVISIGKTLQQALPQETAASTLIVAVSD